uniref:Uncharacterized protein n=1 Tax=uncultured marine virus TaxID=186617 RepID=A0A0F7L646_9VIRU|nr:hypothetical protein [uncultured marine virus]
MDKYKFTKKVIPDKLGIQVSCGMVLDDGHIAESAIHLYEDTEITEDVKVELTKAMDKIITEHVNQSKQK